MGYGFNEPRMLLLLLLLPPTLALYLYYRRKKKKAALKFSSVGALKKARRRGAFMRENLPYALIMLVLTLMILALADPKMPLKDLKEGVSVVLVIDDSGSMTAQDYQPTRLEAAKASAEMLIRSLKEKDNVGIVIFESGATTAAYLTPYKDKAIERLKAIEQKTGKTAIGDGLSLAVDMATSIPNKRRVVILLSDGVNNAGSVSPEDAVQLARKNKIQVHTVGMGSEQPTVIGYDFFGTPQYAELDEATLKMIADGTGGIYRKSVSAGTLGEIYKSIGENIEREEEDTSIKDWVIGGAIASLLALIYVVYGKYRIIL